MNMDDKRIETEVFGVTYDRYVLIQLHGLIAGELGVRTVVETPSHGAKAAGSLYSIGFGLAGADVTLVNPEPEMMYGWDELNIRDRVTTVTEDNIYRTGFSDNTFDLAWNFVTWTELSDPAAYLAEMKRISKSYVLLVTCNNFQPGYPWHRLLHLLFGFPWTHGNVKYNHITTVRKLFRRSGIDVIDYGAIDSPGWPDPSGPRDIRLHRRFTVPKEKPVWRVPIIDYVKNDSYPGWMKRLGKLDMKFRKGVVKLPISHLFYVLGKTNDING